MTELVGLVLPFFIDFINKNIENSKVRYVISLVVCLGVAGVIRFPELTNGDVGQVLQSAGIIFAEAQTVYKLYWEKSALRAKVL